VQPASFEALGIVPFQINPHYLDPDPGSRHMGETREDRIREFLEENDVAVVGLREGAWLRVEGDGGQVGGAASARVFRRGRAPRRARHGCVAGAPALRAELSGELATTYRGIPASTAI
jgi:dipeptidase E